MQPSGPTPPETGVAAHGRKPQLELPRVRRLPTKLIRVLEAMAPRVIDRIVVRIRAEIGPFGGPHRPRLHRLIGSAIDVATEVYLRAAQGDRGGYGRVGEHFRDLGRASAMAGVGVEPAIDAVWVACDLIWDEIRPMVAREEVEGRFVADFASGFASYLTYLESQVRHGFAVTARGAADPPQALLAALLQRRPASDLLAKADAAGWRLDEPVIVVTAQRLGASPAGVVLPSAALSRVDGDRTVVVSRPVDVAAVQEALLHIGPEVVVARSWPLPLRQSWHGYRWTCSVLGLARAGRLRTAGRVIDCSAHRTQLWREADPALLDVIAEDLLAPLTVLKPHWRLMLAETLDRWLEFNESARALGKALGGLHQNTVRHRLRVLRGLYGDRLDDPDSRMELRACLRSVLPAWEAEVRMRQRRRKGTSGPCPDGKAGPAGG